MAAAPATRGVDMDVPACAVTAQLYPSVPSLLAERTWCRRARGRRERRDHRKLISTRKGLSDMQGDTVTRHVSGRGRPIYTIRVVDRVVVRSRSESRSIDHTTLENLDPTRYEGVERRRRPAGRTWSPGATTSGLMRPSSVGP